MEHTSLKIFDVLYQDHQFFILQVFSSTFAFMFNDLQVF